MPDSSDFAGNYVAGMIIKLPGGEERRLSIVEARALHAQLAAIFAPEPKWSSPPPLPPASPSSPQFPPTYSNPWSENVYRKDWNPISVPLPGGPVKK